MLRQHESITLEIFDPNGYKIEEPKNSDNPEGLLRIFDQYALETFGGPFVPVGKYRVSRTKWLFRPAVYKVEQYG
jgi:hypothetical protein